MGLLEAADRPLAHFALLFVVVLLDGRGGRNTSARQVDEVGSGRGGRVAKVALLGGGGGKGLLLGEGGRGSEACNIFIKKLLSKCSISLSLTHESPIGAPVAPADLLGLQVAQRMPSRHAFVIFFS